MKKLLLLLTIILFFTNLNAQQEEQEEYSAYLEQALDAIHKHDKHGFTTNMKYFSTAIERDKITPEILTPKNMDLYSECVTAAFDAYLFSLADIDPGNLAFLEYGAESHPKIMDMLGYVYLTGNENGSILKIPQDLEKSFYWYDKAIEKGSKTTESVIFDVAHASLDYNCKDEDCIAAATRYLEKYAGKGLPYAMNALAEFCCDVMDRLPDNENEKRAEWLDKAQKWYEKALETGNFYEKAKAADGMSFVFGRLGKYKKEKQWKGEYLSWLEKYVEDLEQNHAEQLSAIKDPSNTLKRIDYEDSLSELAIGYEYELGIRDKKKAKFYKDKACRYGLTTFCGK